MVREGFEHRGRCRVLGSKWGYIDYDFDADFDNGPEPIEGGNAAGGKVKNERMCG
ncbi:hypothetical protein [Prosthecochloris sp.]|uniref:hypothetical protein n=1 Tax=Prosthecochloris sp. TaxID=290513 RepID=UPI0025EBF427|nr:hypothetical protein [Prosthecochloris sp.]